MESNKRRSFLRFIINKLSPKGALMLGSVILLLVVVSLILRWIGKSNSLYIEENKRIDLTPTLIKSIEEIGEWEFLQLTDEELIDTIKHGFFGDSRLVRIYYGTLRLGFNLHEAEPGWLKQDKDTLRLMLPPIRLLDKDFIDEARTKAFYESGSWTEADKQALYDRAYKLMMQRCITPANIQTARRNACLQMESMMRSMGFGAVKATFAQPER